MAKDEQLCHGRHLGPSDANSNCTRLPSPSLWLALLARNASHPPDSRKPDLSSPGPWSTIRRDRVRTLVEWLHYASLNLFHATRTGVQTLTLTHNRLVRLLRKLQVTTPYSTQVSRGTRRRRLSRKTPPSAGIRALVQFSSNNLKRPSALYNRLPYHVSRQDARPKFTPTPRQRLA